MVGIKKLTMKNIISRKMKFGLDKRARECYAALKFSRGVHAIQPRGRRLFSNDTADNDGLERLGYYF